MIEKRIIFFICIIGLLLISPVVAKEVTAKVDDKGVIGLNGYGIIGTLHTSYGWITVNDYDYNQIMINDTIRYNTDKPQWTVYWDVEKVN